MCIHSTDIFLETSCQTYKHTLRNIPIFLSVATYPSLDGNSVQLRFLARNSVLIACIVEENFVKLLYSFRPSVQIYKRRLQH